MRRTIDGRNEYNSDGDYIPLLASELEHEVAFAVPIISAGDNIGSIAILHDSITVGDTTKVLVRSFAYMLGTLDE